MRNPSIIQRGLFLGSIGFLFISVLFSITGIPASQVFSLVGGAVSVGFYVFFVRSSAKKDGSAWARHVTFLALVAGIVLKSFGISVGTYLFFVAFVAFLIWFTWQVLEQLPPADKD